MLCIGLLYHGLPFFSDRPVIISVPASFRIALAYWSLTEERKTLSIYPFQVVISVNHFGIDTVSG